MLALRETDSLNEKATSTSNAIRWGKRKQLHPAAPQAELLSAFLNAEHGHIARAVRLTPGKAEAAACSSSHGSNFLVCVFLIYGFDLVLGESFGIA